MKNTFCRLSIMLTVVLLVSQSFFVEEAFARKRRRSFSSRKKSSWSSKKSKSKGSSFSFSKKKSKTKTKTYSSRSKTRSKKGSVFNSNSKKTSRGTSLSQAAKRADSKSKFTSSQKGKQTTKTYRDVVRENKSLSDNLTVQNKKNRNKRRKSFYDSYSPSNNYYRYSPNVAYRDPYDNFFFKYVTFNWLFHHWNSIDKSRFDEARLRELEDKVEEMEAQGIERDPNYTLPGMEPDLQYSDEELENLQEAKEVLEFEAEREEDKSGFGWLTIFLVGLVAVGGIYFVAVRRY